MQAFNQMLFDETIVGAATPVYTPDQYNDLLGAADVLSVMVHVSNPGGTDPRLTVTMQHSADGRHWNDISPNLVDDVDITQADNQLLKGQAADYLSLFRLKITLTGTNPECRLKLYATGRNG